MPIKNNTVFCINHSDTEMARVDGFNAITAISVDEASIRFQGDKGVPILMHFCPICGYVENYVAMKTKEWDEAPMPMPSYQEFERLALDILKSNLGKLGLASIQGAERFVSGSDNVEVDAIGSSADGAKVIFEIKASANPRSIESASHQLFRAIKLYSRLFPGVPVYGALVVPSTVEFIKPYNDYSVVKIDVANRDVTLEAVPVQPSVQ